MNRKSVPLLIKPKPCRPKLTIPCIQSESCIAHYPHTDSSTDLDVDYNLDDLLERRMKSDNAAISELEDKQLCHFSYAFRPPSTRPMNPFMLVAD